jgi:hypothetical protein
METLGVKLWTMWVGCMCMHLQGWVELQRVEGDIWALPASLAVGCENL